MKSRAPFVRRTVYRRLERKYEALIEAMRVAPDDVQACPIRAVKAAEGPLGPELCLFVTYAPFPRLKHHVVRHVEALLAEGVKVILIANTPLAPDRLEVDPGLVERLAGVYVRANLGYDFAAWAHGMSLLGAELDGCERLILANDSIVGPIRPGQIADVLGRVRASAADVLGLTLSREPRPHLQSFFLVFQGRALGSPAFARFWRGVRTLPTKQLVIDLYETHLTAHLASAGLLCEPLFQLTDGHTSASNDVYHRWPRLIEIGFPFVKASVLEENWSSSAVTSLIPREILDAYEFAPSATSPRTTRGGS